MLVDKHVTPFEFNKLLKEQMKNFPCHWFSDERTSSTYDHAIDNLIKDFSENYTCLLHEEIMSIHRTQEQATDSRKDLL